MLPPRTLSRWALGLTFIAVSSGLDAHSWQSSEQMSAAATAFLATLSPEQKQAVRAALDSPKRGGWSNLPVFAVPRPGLLMKDMNTDQRRAVHELLRASMSSQGYAKFTGIMRLEETLREQAQARFDQTPEAERTAIQAAVLETRDPTLYAVAIFGEPGSTRWGWQFSGHHAAANFTVADGQVAFTPTFVGSSPRVIESGPHTGYMALPQEGDRGLELMLALDNEQRARALAAKQLPEGIFAGPGRKDSLSAFEGLNAEALNATQRRLLRVLVEEYVANADFDVAEAQMAAIDEAGWDALWFSWRGPVNAAGRFYYRVHGPRILIEYNRVDENHDHSIVRDPKNDYGADWLGQHLEEHHPSSEDIQQRLRQLTGTPGDD